MKKLLFVSICLFVSGCATASVSRDYVLSARVKCPCAPQWTYSMVAKFNNQYKNDCYMAAGGFTRFENEVNGKHVYECFRQEEWQELEKNNQVIP